MIYSQNTIIYMKNVLAYNGLIVLVGVLLSVIIVGDDKRYVGDSLKL